MKVKDQLLKLHFKSIDIIPHISKQEIIEQLELIMKEDYDELMQNPIFADNFLEIVSHLYLHEQLKKFDDEKDSSLHVSIFSKHFTAKLNKLIDFIDEKNDHYQSVSC
jgi:hypothetical protein